MAEWIAFGDETGTHAGSKYCAVLGYVASPRQWKLFKRDWKDALGKVPRFHAVEFFQRSYWRSASSPYTGWTDSKAGRFLDSLVRTINRYDLRPIGFAYEVAPFKALGLEERRRLTGAVRMNRVRKRRGEVNIRSKLISTGAPSEPYFLGFAYFITEASKAVPPGARVSFVFDRRGQSESRAAETFAEIMQFTESPSLSDRLGLLSFGDSRVQEPLQAADLYAYVMNRVLHDSVDDLVLKALMKLTKKKDKIGIADAELYRKLIEHQDFEQTKFFQRALT